MTRTARKNLRLALRALRAANTHLYAAELSPSTTDSERALLGAERMDVLRLERDARRLLAEVSP